jgi:type I restriction enzyme S subunit
MNAAPTNGSSRGSRDWQERVIGDCLMPFEIEIGKKVLARDYKANGKFPIVDQGQSLVAGYTDNTLAVIAEGLPVVVFGDHTRVFKFVDFPFVIGADGTKLLKPIAELDPKFFYFACLALDIPSRGYNRHFKILREQPIRYPDFPEQEKIAAMLWKIQKAAEIEDTIVRSARDLKKSLLRRLFTHGLRGEPFKETDIGPLPQSWEIVELQSVAKFASGGTPSKQEPSFWSGDIPWLSPKDMKAARLHDTQDHISEAGLLASSNRVKAGSLFVVIRGMILNRDLPVAIAMKPMAFNQDMKAILPNDTIDGEFLLYTFESQKRRLFSQIGTSAHGTRTLMSDYLAKFQFALPCKQEQREIADILQTVDRKVEIHESKKRSLQELFKIMLHKLMTVQIRVNDLEIDISEIAK